jgi:hypothetical protein
MVDQKYSNQHSIEYINQDIMQVNIKAEQNSPPTISGSRCLLIVEFLQHCTKRKFSENILSSSSNFLDDSVQELQDISQDSTNQQQFFQPVDVMLDDDQSSSSIHMTSSATRRSPLSLLQSGNGI